MTEFFLIGVAVIALFGVALGICAIWPALGHFVAELIDATEVTIDQDGRSRW